MSDDHNMYCSANNKQEPVAINYTCPNCQTHVELFHHTAQQYRELSDEEIMTIYNDQANRDFQLRSDPFKFARAILKKASEK